ncbi:MAG: response regulator transcription factor [Candidatus Hodarchaeales archaeon]
MSTPSILIIEDNPEFLELLDLFLRDKFPNANISKEKNAEKGLEAIEDHYNRGNEFDLVICDALLPTMSGLDLITEIKLREYDVTFILITAYDTKLLRSHAETIGIEYFISKNKGIQEMIDEIEKILNNNSV